MKRLGGIPLVVAVGLMAGCGVEGSAPSSPAGGKADDLDEVLLDFTGYFEERQSGPLVAGATAVVRYDAARLPQCRGRDQGVDTWAITGYVVVEGEDEQPFALTRRDGERVVSTEGRITVPAADSFALYFLVHDTFGCSEYDSDFGANYRFEVEPAPAGDAAVVAFELGAELAVSGELRAGGEAILHYDPERLAGCAASQAGNVQWNITGFVQVDDGEAEPLLVGRGENGELVAADPRFEVGAGELLSLWFESSSIYGCHESDPPGGGRYQLQLAP